MKCYNCGCSLTGHGFCTNCGVDVRRYKMVISASNILYNEGLEKARVRDLSGAIASLRQCLKLNKNHVDARNLLGLVYFEIGESVMALNEWVISKNLRVSKNIADDYLGLLQNNPGKLDALNAAIKKYNQALNYCYQDSLDLAVIQLKKVLSMNPKYLQAHQLLALLYINSGEWSKAKKELERSRRIDANNTRTLLYLREVDKMVTGEEPAEKNSGTKKSAGGINVSEDSYQYQSGNETIIQPINLSDGRKVHSIGNLMIGLAIGFAVAWFLILPARIQNAKAEMNEEMKTVSEQLDVKTATINDLESRIKALEKENSELGGQLEAFVGANGTLEDVDHLLQAAKLYIETPNAITKIAEELDKIDSEAITETTSKSFTELYDLLLTAVGSEVGGEYFKAGMDAYQASNYKEAITNLSKAVTYDEKNADALYQLANAYRKDEQAKEAIEAYKKVIEKFPGTDMANRSQSYINDLEKTQ